VSVSLAARACLLLALVTLTACGAQPPAPPPFKPVADMLTLMTAVIDPSADVVWDSVAHIVTKDGTEERMPRTDEEWARVRSAALVLAESGNLLMMPSRARDAGEWMTMARAMIDSGEAAAKAAEAKDPKGILATGEQIYDACVACHTKYLATTPPP
jgi:hypothetical protein